MTKDNSEKFRMMPYQVRIFLCGQPLNSVDLIRLKKIILKILDICPIRDFSALVSDTLTMFWFLFFLMRL